MSDVDRDPFQEAIKRGCIVVVPEPNQLFVDIDDEFAEKMFLTTLEVLNRDRPLHEHWKFTKSPSPSGKPGRFHIVVTMHAPVTEEVRLGLQAILGSDRVREALCWRRVERGDKPVTCFFEKES